MFFFSRGDNKGIAKIHYPSLIIFFSRTIGLISTKLGIKHHWLKGTQYFTSKVIQLSKRRRLIIFFSTIHHYDVMIAWANVFIHLKWFFRWAMWPMGLLFIFLQSMYYNLCRWILIMVLVLTISWCNKYQNCMKKTADISHLLWLYQNICQ